MLSHWASIDKLPNSPLALFWNTSAPFNRVALRILVTYTSMDNANGVGCNICSKRCFMITFHSSIHSASYSLVHNHIWTLTNLFLSLHKKRDWHQQISEIIVHILVNSIWMAFFIMHSNGRVQWLKDLPNIASDFFNTISPNDDSTVKARAIYFNRNLMQYTFWCTF